MKKLLQIFIFLLLVSSVKIFANAAMPGFYNMGGSAEFVPFFASDSIHIGKIQMQSEQITVLLYPNFAVVRGEYRMLNLTDKEIILNTGYPVNSQFSNELVYSVSFDDIHALKVFVDEKETQTEKLPQNDSTFRLENENRHSNNNWHVWKTKFKANAITKIKVYFIVNTSNSLLRKGYSKDEDNGFVYILESGGPWANNIEKGRINVQLMDGLKAADIIGISPQKFVMNEEGSSLIYDFKNLEPTGNDNVIIRYKGTDGQFDFNAITSNFQKYYDEIDRIQPANIFAESYKSFTPNDFKVHNTTGETAIGLAFFFAIFGIPILIVVIIIVIIFVIIRRKKRRKQRLTS